MSLSEEERNALVFYKIQKSKDTFNEAVGIAQLCFWNAVANRLYYASYYITTALLVLYGHSAQTHSGVIRLFGLNFVNRGIVSKDMSKLYSKLFELRQTGDYDDLYNLTEEDVKPLIGLTQHYINEIESLIASRNNIEMKN
ncbi:MAG TPA: HEPN domain-containing protein [Paludibacter sp.]|nr:HEPN domain-containing protein [Paludibacter sp.]